jgi:glycosyltransferase involved in cell wall biosynthesis
MPSLVEPFGHVYVEAGTVGVGSIGTTEGGAADAIGEGGVLVAPHDHAALLDAMRRYCDPSFAIDMGIKALAHSKLLSWDLVTQRVLRALDISIPGLELADFL